MRSAQALSRIARRSLSTLPRRRAAQSPLAAFAREQYEPPTVYGSGYKGEEATFKAHFDYPGPVFLDINGGNSGMFLYRSVQKPSDLQRLTDRTILHVQAIVERIRAAPLDPTGKELRLVVKNLDRLSDLLCGVVDMCELLRHAHPDEQWVTESDLAYERLCSFMNELNTDQGLYKSLLAMLNHTFSEPLSEAETQVALTFQRDFEKSGIHLATEKRQRFVELSDSILSLGRTFLTSASSPKPYPPIELPDAERLLAGMGSQFIDSLQRGRRGSRLVTPGSWAAQMIGRYAREGEARRLVYIGSLPKDTERIDVLEQMLRERAELAGVLGKENWAQIALVDKMAKNPANVYEFLSSLADHHRAAASQDVATLQRLKASNITGNVYSPDEGTGHLPPLNAWDRDFWSERHLLSLSNGASLPPITPYFSTGTVMLGMSKLFSRLYGISLKPAPLATGEAWHSSVRRLDVIDEKEGVIGVIYCDFFSREGKPPNAAHYTVRCSRRVDDDDVRGDMLPANLDETYGQGLEAGCDTVTGPTGVYQRPIVVLTTDFGEVEAGRPALLGWHDVETLFHEMGHAIHSMIGRTEYHNVSGTRCATDFVELPSILMEHFAQSPTVLSLFATHYATGEALPMPLLEQHFSMQRSLAALETHGQIGVAMLDQAYHSITPESASAFDSTATWHDLNERIGVIPPVRETAWQIQFGHLHGYGATYYSYLFDRAIAGKVWRTLFNHSPEGSLSREGGEVLKEQVLKWGGGRDPWVMVGELVGGKEGEILMRGNEESMRVVGGWEIR